MTEPEIIPPGAPLPRGPGRIHVHVRIGERTVRAGPGLTLLGLAALGLGMVALMATALLVGAVVVAWLPLVALLAAGVYIMRKLGLGPARSQGQARWGARPRRRDD